MPKIIGFKDTLLSENFAVLKNLKQIIRCLYVDVSERVVLLLRYKIDVKKDITL